MGSFLGRIASVAAWSRRTGGGIASAVPKPGTEGSDDAGSLVNTGEENFPADAFVAVSHVQNHQNISASDSYLSNVLAKV